MNSLKRGLPCSCCCDVHPHIVNDNAAIRILFLNFIDYGFVVNIFSLREYRVADVGLSDVCQAFYLHKKLGAAYVCHKIVFAGCGVVYAHISAYGRDIALVLYINAQETVV